MRKLGELVDIKTGKLDANAADQDGLYPFFTCAVQPLKINTYAYDCECALVAGNGDLNVKYYNGKFNAYQRVYIIESKDKNILDTDYLSKFLALSLRKLRSKTKGAVIQFIRLGDLTNLKINLPLLEEQKLITQSLSKAENLIAQRKESIRLLDEFLKSTFLEMFGDPVRNEKGFESITLGDLFRVSSGDGLTSENMNPSGKHNVYGGNGVNGKHNRYMFEEPQIVIGRVGYYCGAVHLTEPKSWVTDNALYIKELYKASNIYYLKQFLTLLKLNRYAGKAAQPLISGNRLYPIKTFYAPIELQTQFAQIVEKTEALKSQYQQSLSELENLYGSLSQKAFRGELTR